MTAEKELVRKLRDGLFEAIHTIVSEFKEPDPEEIARNPLIAEADAWLASGGKQVYTHPAPQESGGLRPMETAPKDGTMLRLLVQYTDCNVEDNDQPQWTMGFNDEANSMMDDWQIVGWSWTHDCFVEARDAVPIGWLPFSSALPLPATPKEWSKS